MDFPTLVHVAVDALLASIFPIEKLFPVPHRTFASLTPAGAPLRIRTAPTGARRRRSTVCLLPAQLSQRRQGILVRDFPVGRRGSGRGNRTVGPQAFFCPAQGTGASRTISRSANTSSGAHTSASQLNAKASTTNELSLSSSSGAHCNAHASVAVAARKISPSA